MSARLALLPAVAAASLFVAAAVEAGPLTAIPALALLPGWAMEQPGRIWRWAHETPLLRAGALLALWLAAGTPASRG